MKSAGVGLNVAADLKLVRKVGSTSPNVVSVPAVGGLLLARSDDGLIKHCTCTICTRPQKAAAALSRFWF